MKSTANLGYMNQVEFHNTQIRPHALRGIDTKDLLCQCPSYVYISKSLQFPCRIEGFLLLSMCFIEFRHYRLANTSSRSSSFIGS